MASLEVLVSMDTPDGKAEARKVGTGEWLIGYPNGDDRFHGSKAEVTKLMRERIAADYTNETTMPVYVQPPNNPDHRKYVCDVPKDSRRIDVLAAIGVKIEQVVDAKRIGGKNPRWSVVAT